MPQILRCFYPHWVALMICFYGTKYTRNDPSRFLSLSHKRKYRHTHPPPLTLSWDTDTRALSYNVGRLLAWPPWGRGHAERPKEPQLCQPPLPPQLCACSQPGCWTCEKSLQMIPATVTTTSREASSKDHPAVPTQPLDLGAK